MDERDVMNAWRKLFRDKETARDDFAAAEALLNSLSGESPLHLRLANELEELKKAQRTEREGELAASPQREQQT